MQLVEAARVQRIAKLVSEVEKVIMGDGRSL